jgi:RNA polymerase sigma factor (sigma-70 family)
MTIAFPLESGFHSTHWSLVRRAQSPDSKIRGAARGQLQQDYYPLIRSWMLSQGLQIADAEDLLQDFLLKWFLGDFFDRDWDETRRFRSFLKASLRNFLIDRHRKESHAKRNAALPDLIEVLADSDDSERSAFDQHWAAFVLSFCLHSLAEERRESGEPIRFRVFFDRVLGPVFFQTETPSYDELARRYGIEDDREAESLVNNERRRLASMISTAVGKYSNTEDATRDELQYLRRVVASAKELGIQIPVPDAMISGVHSHSPEWPREKLPSFELTRANVDRFADELFLAATELVARAIQDPRLARLRSLLPESLEVVIGNLPSDHSAIAGRSLAEALGRRPIPRELHDLIRPRFRELFQTEQSSPEKAVWLLLYHTSIAACLIQTGSSGSRLSAVELHTAFSKQLADNWFGPPVEEVLQMALHRIVRTEQNSG